MEATGPSVFEKRFKSFLGIVILYILAVPVMHAVADPRLVWFLAAVFSITMNFTYPVQAVEKRSFTGTELGVAGGLIFASLLGVWVHPFFVIAAIFGHGVWDWLKHRGRGVKFFSWYPPLCAVYDFAYAAILFWYYLAVFAPGA